MYFNDQNVCQEKYKRLKRKLRGDKSKQMKRNRGLNVVHFFIY